MPINQATQKQLILLDLEEDGMTHAEIAKLVGVRHEAVTRMISRAKAAVNLNAALRQQSPLRRLRELAPISSPKPYAGWRARNSQPED